MATAPPPNLFPDLSYMVCIVAGCLSLTAFKEHPSNAVVRTYCASLAGITGIFSDRITTAPGGVIEEHRTSEAINIIKMLIAVRVVVTALLALMVGANWITDDAATWLNPPVPYSQSSYYNGYRQDCSGYVSMAWQLGTSATTWTIPNYSYQIDKSELQPGDVLLNIDEHVLLFAGWADDAQSQYWAYEQTPPQTIYHVVQYPYWPGYGTYLPYRLNGMAANATEAALPFVPGNATMPAKASLRGTVQN